MRRRVLTVLAILVALVALLFWLTASDDSSSVATPRAPLAAETSPRTPRRRSEPPQTTTTTTADEGESSDAASAEPDGSPLFPELVVEVRDCDGKPVPVGEAWARVSRYEPMDFCVARAQLDAEGTCQLRLPMSGRYDVYASDGEMLGCREWNVDPATTPRVRLQLPKAAELRFVRGDDEASLQGTATVCAGKRWPDMILSSGSFTLRDVSSELSRTISLRDLPVTLRSIAGATLHYARDVEPSIATPDEFTAPATITISRPKWGSYRLLVSMEPAERPMERPSFFTTEFEIVGGGRIDRWDSPSAIWSIDAGARTADGMPFEFGQSPPARHSVVRWKGRGIQPGEASIDVGDEGVVDVPVVLHLADGPLATSSLVARVDGPDGTDASLWIASHEGSVDANVSVPVLGADQSLEFPPGWTPHALVAAAPGLVAEPRRLVVGGRHEFDLVPGGNLRVVRGIRPPDGVDLRLRRKDFLPLRSDSSTPFGAPGSTADAALDEAAVVLGPFAPGDVELEVTYGETVIAELKAHVVAGETTDVVLPLAERLPKR